MIMCRVKYRYKMPVRTPTLGGLDSEFSHYETREATMNVVAPYKELVLVHMNYQFRNDDHFSVISVDEIPVHAMIDLRYR